MYRPLDGPFASSSISTAAVGRSAASTPTIALAVAGDSAGGTLAALSCLRLRDGHPNSLPDLQVLICANTDLTGDHPSMHEKASGFGLDDRHRPLRHLRPRHQREIPRYEPR